jgi:spermidine synthase
MTDSSANSSSTSQFIFEDQTENLQLGFRVTQTLLSVQTPYQKLDVYQTVEFGKLMMLDDKVMLTERDEFFYHEMLVHPALLSHPNPRRVAVIGGGDGGAVREILKHPSVEEIIWVEIDGAVVEASREFFPTVSEQALSDRRVKLNVAPGEDILPQYDDYFDVLIVDSTDPIGPAVPLFEAPFFRMCQKSLKADGIYVTQCGTPLYFPDEIHSVSQQLRQVFEQVRFYVGFIPFYPSGLWSYVMGSQAVLQPSVEEIGDRFQAANLSCRYYTPQLHHASAALPQFVADLVAR